MHTTEQILEARRVVAGPDPEWEWSGKTVACRVCGAHVEVTVDELNVRTGQPPRSTVCVECDWALGS